MLVIISHLLNDLSGERGETFFEERDRQGTKKRLVRQLSIMSSFSQLPWLDNFLLDLVGGGIFSEEVFNGLMNTIVWDHRPLTGAETQPAY